MLLILYHRLSSPNKPREKNVVAETSIFSFSQSVFHPIRQISSLELSSVCSLQVLSVSTSEKFEHFYLLPIEESNCLQIYLNLHAYHDVTKTSFSW